MMYIVTIILTTGCYNGCVYTMLANTGSIHWCCSLAHDNDNEVEPVKSSPVCDPSSGLVWVGSHDQHMYALNVEVIINMLSYAHNEYDATAYRVRMWFTECMLEVDHVSHLHVCCHIVH